ncbi:nuclease SbcCD, D subunit [Nitrosococcus halophilus Nc 4]|uniref:Nuclease SbcCD subunit D n=2 Tax=Nitrosococcus halophilus TaxID=133539 RepID=D5C3W4_NITHN|nr:nuclease SbcCD, D subunit [Nitrosococcus halophilus Nc 4]
MGSAMRIMHTSDWHLGQYFMGKSREREHQAFLDWLLVQIKEQGVDALIVAGDIFDTGTPPSYARALYNNFVVSLQPTGCQLVVIGGNHDSVATLHESRQLLACLNTWVVGGIEGSLAQQVKVLKRRDGQPGAVLCAVPYLRPREVLTSQAGESGQDKRQVLQSAIQAHYDRVYQLACEQQDNVGEKLPIIATGHLTTVGGEISESVREIYIGTLEAFPASAFPPADYIALGHLHQAQRVGRQDHIRYSGSPIPLSFDEAASPKQVLLADFAQGRLQQVESLPVPRFQGLQTLQGSLSEIEAQVHELMTSVPPQEILWLEVEVAGDDYLSDLQNRVQALCEGKPVELLRVRRQRRGRPTALRREARETLTELTVEEVFERRLSLEDFQDEALVANLKTAFQQIAAELKPGQAAEEDSQEWGRP